MNRRPKLSLVSNRGLNKKQALGVETAKTTGTKQSGKLEPAGADFVQQATRPEPVRPEQLKATNRPDEHLSDSGWLNGRLLAKAVIVVVTAALSIYLLKRRLL